jgi:hypothetical protein
VCVCVRERESVCVWGHGRVCACAHMHNILQCKAIQLIFKENDYAMGKYMVGQRPI